MPNQSSQASFTFGYGTGFLVGCLISSGIPFDFEKPKNWQKEFKPPMKSKKLLKKDKEGLTEKEISEKQKQYKAHNNKVKQDHKNELKQIAQRLFPEEHIVLENADAYLIAEYSRRVLMGKI